MDDNTHYENRPLVDIDGWYCLCGFFPGFAFDLLWWAR